MALCYDVTRDDKTRWLEFGAYIWSIQYIVCLTIGDVCDFTHKVVSADGFVSLWWAHQGLADHADVDLGADAPVGRLRQGREGQDMWLHASHSSQQINYSICMTLSPLCVCVRVCVCVCVCVLLTWAFSWSTEKLHTSQVSGSLSSLPGILRMADRYRTSRWDAGHTLCNHYRGGGAVMMSLWWCHRKEAGSSTCVGLLTLCAWKTMTAFSDNVSTTLKFSMVAMGTEKKTRFI